MRTILLTIFLSIMSLSWAQKADKFKTITIKTSALCGDCEERIENKLNYTKGIKYADLDLKTNIVTVKYKANIITSTGVKALITSIGYHADDLERDLEAFDTLPGCCKDLDAKCSKKEPVD